MISGDQVRVQTFVRIPLRDAFDVFTLEIDAWWRHGPAYRVGGRHVGPISLEPQLGGRVLQIHGPRQDQLHVIGAITAWDPPAHVAFTWRGVNFEDADADTFVDVWFEGTTEGTRVTVQHRGFAALRDDHPVRHGKPAAEFLGELGRWWGGLATSLREHADRPSSYNVGDRE